MWLGGTWRCACMELIDFNNDINLALQMGDVDRLAELVEQRDNQLEIELAAEDVQ